MYLLKFNITSRMPIIKLYLCFLIDSPVSGCFVMTNGSLLATTTIGDEDSTTMIENYICCTKTILQSILHSIITI